MKTKLKNFQEQVFIVKSFGKPVQLRPWLEEHVPEHADMLRYDLAFHDPKDPSRVIFPQFKSTAGNLGGRQTLGRWSSFVMTVNPTGEAVSNFGDWITYRHGQEQVLVPMTVIEYLGKGGR